MINNKGSQKVEVLDLKSDFASNEIIFNCLKKYKSKTLLNILNLIKCIGILFIHYQQTLKLISVIISLKKTKLSEKNNVLQLDYNVISNQQWSIFFRFNLSMSSSCDETKLDFC